ncbi:FAD-dependent oxidoreductase [Methyloradius palustris]|uniref:Ubiquinone biosynthesis hydroxylase UbiH n=1 Tax=Methyloradius palustris TaxID=2778876 RepID=A0A8D5JME4_9PROT|nr:FAD-dependent oxidoreductase [Methyloradius palustris]BCM25780.1 ubiquinone biosynthesis hydroxylase UbiH [Methyloradius palustris]
MIGLTKEFDVVIVGGGLVGSAAAIALTQQGLSVALLDRLTPVFNPPTQDDHDWDARIYAITPGNRNWLKKLGVWNTLDLSRVCPIENMQVWADSDREPLNFSSYEAHLNSLGDIIESRLLQQALWLKMQSVAVHIETGADCTSLKFSDDFAIVATSSGQLFKSKLLIAADGSNSWVRAQAGITVNRELYAQQALVANFATEQSHQNIARQWFDADGVLAWLPLPDHKISIVWSTEEAKGLSQLSPDELATKVAQAGGHCLGQLSLIGQPQVFPIAKLKAESVVEHRVVLLGDAAHQVHPLAGQGVNLGFRDVIELDNVLTKRNVKQDIGDIMLLRKYARARKADVLALESVTHGLHDLFGSSIPFVKKLRSFGLEWVNQQPTLKQYLIKQAVI